MAERLKIEKHNMKTLIYKLNESLLDDEEDLVDNNDVIIEQFLNDNYNIRGSYSIKNNIVDVNGSIELLNTNLEYLTNGLFNFGKVTNAFTTGYEKNRLINIKSLKGSPTEVGIFYLSRSKITSLEGGPKIVKGYYNVCYNDNLVSLEGAPEKVNGSFMCYGCKNLKSLKGSPKKIGIDFDCSECPSLTELKYGPEMVGGDYICYDCNNLSSIKGVAKVIKKTLDCQHCEKIIRSEFLEEIKKIKVNDWVL